MASQAMRDQATAPKATRKEWLGLAVIALPCMLYSMDLTILNLAVPALARDLKPSANQLLWIIDIYGFMVAGFLMIMGALGDKLGRRKVLLFGAAAFGAASVVAAFAASPEMLIIARALLGIAGATLAPSTLSLISNMFRDPAQRTFAIGMWIASFSAGAILGPLAGGVLLHYFWWGSAFLAGVPVMALLLVLGPFLLPEFRDPGHGKLDYPSALLSLAAVLSFIYGVKQIAEYGVAPSALMALIAGVGIGFAFFRKQATVDDPLLDLQLFQSRVFSLSLAVNVLALFFMFGSFVFTAQYLQLVLGLSALEAGFWSLPGAIIFTIVSAFNGWLSKRLSGLQLLAGGMSVSALGFASLFMSSGLVSVTLANILVAIGFTPVISLTTGYIVGAAPPEKAGVASALSETSAELGGALGMALLGSMATFIYRNRMAGAVPADIPSAIAAPLRSSLAAASEALKALPAEAATPILATARAAFMDAFHATAVIAALTLMFLAALATRVLSSANPRQHGEPS
jgi:MFS transporter, DHA2 family, multidrug resistance protein